METIDQFIEERENFEANVFKRALQRTDLLQAKALSHLQDEDIKFLAKNFVEQKVELEQEKINAFIMKGIEKMKEDARVKIELN